jgi:chromosome segregation ATPase
MATGNGQDPATIQMVELLGAIYREMQGMRGELNGMRSELNGMRSELRATNERLDTLHDDVVDLRADVHELRAEVHAIREDLVNTKGDHAARLRRLEDAVFKPAAE